MVRDPHSGMLVGKARKNAERLGYLTAEDIPVGRGRGKTGTALQATPATYNLLKITPKYATLGGDGPLHAWIVSILARHLPGSIVDQTFNGTSADIILRVTNDHEAFIALLDRHAHHLLQEPMMITAGMLLAIEVESSQPTKTAKNNLKNHAGADAVCFLVVKDLMGTIASLTDAIPEAEQHKVRIADALIIADTLRKGTP